MAANRRRLVHRLQAEDPLDLLPSGDKYALGRIGLARLGRPDSLVLTWKKQREGAVAQG
jgi:hypothetical protein